MTATVSFLPLCFQPHFTRTYPQRLLPTHSSHHIPRHLRPPFASLSLLLPFLFQPPQTQIHPLRPNNHAYTQMPFFNPLLPRNFVYHRILLAAPTTPLRSSATNFNALHPAAILTFFPTTPHIPYSHTSHAPTPTCAHTPDASLLHRSALFHAVATPPLSYELLFFFRRTHPPPFYPTSSLPRSTHSTPPPNALYPVSILLHILAPLRPFFPAGFTACHSPHPTPPPTALCPALAPLALSLSSTPHPNPPPCALITTPIPKCHSSTHSCHAILHIN